MIHRLFWPVSLVNTFHKRNLSRKILFMRISVLSNFLENLKKFFLLKRLTKLSRIVFLSNNWIQRFVLKEIKGFACTSKTSLDLESRYVRKMITGKIRRLLGFGWNDKLDQFGESLKFEQSGTYSPCHILLDQSQWNTIRVENRAKKPEEWKKRNVYDRSYLSLIIN